jgi:hypothetical protein
MFHIGLSSGNIPDGSLLGNLQNTYAFNPEWDFCRISGQQCDFHLPNGRVDDWIPGHTTGCGILLNPGNEVSIFFTVNETLFGEFPFIMMK